MLEQGRKDPLKTYGFLIAVKFMDGPYTTPDYLADKLADALSWVEGTGKVDVEWLGEIPEFEEKDTDE